MLSSFMFSQHMGVTKLMSAAAPVPLVPKHLEFFPLEKCGHASFSLVASVVIQCQFSFVCNSTESQQMLYRGFGANFYDDQSQREQMSY